jgi:hypothetical protein
VNRGAVTGNTGIMKPPVGGPLGGPRGDQHGGVGRLPGPGGPAPMRDKIAMPPVPPIRPRRRAAPPPPPAAPPAPGMPGSGTGPAAQRAWAARHAGDAGAGQGGEATPQRVATRNLMNKDREQGRAF